MSAQSNRLTAEGGASPWVVSRSDVDNVDAYSKSVAGIELEAVRTGQGRGPNHVLTVVDERFALTSCDVGFPMRSHAAIDDERILVASITSAPSGSRWCEIDLHPGAVIVYGAGAEHTAIDVPGLEFTFTITDEGRLAEVADRMELQSQLPPTGEVHELASTSTSRAVVPALSGLARDARSGSDRLGRQTDDVMRAMVLALTEEDRVRRVGSSGGIDSRHVVHMCIDYADATQRIPSISELCLTAHVSERRLRQAFVDEFDLPPSRYFRHWALAVARRRLLDCDRQGHSVTEIAADVGFGHFGRFAGHYLALYGETPSWTLRAPPRRAS